MKRGSLVRVKMSKIDPGTGMKYRYPIWPDEDKNKKPQYVDMNPGVFGIVLGSRLRDGYRKQSWVWVLFPEVMGWIWEEHLERVE